MDRIGLIRRMGILALGLFGSIAQAPAATPVVPVIAYGFADFPPLAYVDASGQTAGAGLEFMRELTHEAGYPVQIRAYPQLRWLKEIESGKIGMWATGEIHPLSQRVGLASHYEMFSFKTCVVGPAGSGRLQIPEDLRNKRLILSIGSPSAAKEVQALLNDQALQLEKIIAPNHEAALGMLALGRGDYVLTNSYALVTGQERDRTLTCTPLAETKMRYWVNRSVPGAEQLRDALDAAFLRMADEGRLPAWVSPPAH